MLNQVTIPAGKVGEAEICVDTPTAFERLSGAIHGMPLTQPQYTRLLINGQTMMTDAEFEIQTNYEFDRRATGRVLIAGLGIGLILGNILTRESVESVTVVEKSEDVILLVGASYTNPKLTILHDDIFNFEPKAALRGMKFDVIYFDIWPDICQDYYAEIKTLKAKFRKHLTPGGWMAAWCETRMKNGR